jgi:hypothetical protein
VIAAELRDAGARTKRVLVGYVLERVWRGTISFRCSVRALT